MNTQLRPDTPAERRLREQQDLVLSKRAILVQTAKHVRIEQPEAPELDAMIHDYKAAQTVLRRLERGAPRETAAAAGDG